MANILIIHGPNLNLLGQREPEIYGNLKLEDIDKALNELAQELDVSIKIMQTNHEGGIVDAIQKAGTWADVLIINPAAYTHTSVAILDAIKAMAIPTIEVHLSNVYARESFRHQSTIAGAVTGRLMGFGLESYTLALRAAKSLSAK